MHGGSCEPERFYGALARHVRWNLDSEVTKSLKIDQPKWWNVFFCVLNAELGEEKRYGTGVW